MVDYRMRVTRHWSAVPVSGSWTSTITCHFRGSTGWSNTDSETLAAVQFVESLGCSRAGGSRYSALHRGAFVVVGGTEVEVWTGSEGSWSPVAKWAKNLDLRGQSSDAVATIAVTELTANLAIYAAGSAGAAGRGTIRLGPLQVGVVQHRGLLQSNSEMAECLTDDWQALADAGVTWCLGGAGGIRPVVRARYGEVVGSDIRRRWPRVDPSSGIALAP